MTLNFNEFEKFNWYQNKKPINDHFYQFIKKYPEILKNVNFTF